MFILLELLLLGYYFIGIKVEISKKVPFGKKSYFHVKREKRQKSGKGQRKPENKG